MKKNRLGVVATTCAMASVLALAGCASGPAGPSSGNVQEETPISQSANQDSDGISNDADNTGYSGTTENTDLDSENEGEELDGTNSQITQTVISASDIKVSDLKLEENKAAIENNKDSDYYYYYLTGNLTNTSSLDATEIEFMLKTTPHSTDNYGDDVAGEPRSAAFYSLTPGVTDETFYDVKSNETRSFTFAVYGDKQTDPQLVIEDVSTQIDPDSKVAFDDRFTVTQEKGNDRQAVMMIKNNTGKAVKSAYVRYSYVTESGEPKTDRNEISLLADLERPIVFDTSYGDHDFKILDFTYEEDTDALSANFSDLFSSKMDTEGGVPVCALTNNSGKYLSVATVRYMYTNEDGLIDFYDATFNNMKPGATMTEELQKGTDHKIVYAEYYVDEDKESTVASQGKTDNE